MANADEISEDGIEPIRSTPTESPSPGYLLKVRRQQIGWSAKDVAKSLRLSEHQIVAIEDDDFDKLPEMTYVVGYWRSYAQLLKVDIGDSIAAYRGTISINHSVTTARKEKPQIHSHSAHPRKRAAIFFGLLLVGFLAAVWYWQSPNAELIDWRRFGLSTNDAIDRQTVGAVVEDGLSVTQVPAEPALAIPIPNFSNGEATVEINTKGYEVLIAELPLPASKLVYQVAPEESASEGLIVDTTSQETAIIATTAAVVTPAIALEVIAETAPEIASNEIIFTIEQESWIDVRDAQGERLIYRTVLAGEDIRLEGVPPYAVFIGSAEGVSITYKNKNVPFALDASGSYARFSVGAP